jgi:DNA-binding transcriptional MocR family regulator
VLELAARHQVPIVEDGIYSALRLRGRETPSLKALDAHGLVIHINSFSKVCFSGLRVGWMVASEPVIERLRLAKQATDLHTDQLAQAALAEFGRRGWLGRLVKKARSLYRSRLARMETALEAHFPDEVAWTRPKVECRSGSRCPPGWTLPPCSSRPASSTCFHPGRFFYFQAVQPNTLRLGFAGVNEKQIGRESRCWVTCSRPSCATAAAPRSRPRRPRRPSLARNCDD